MVRDRYYKWLTSFVVNDSRPYHKYNLLLERLHQTDFEFDQDANPLDEDRYRDGLDMRDRFTHETRYDTRVLDVVRPGCTMLEMLVALASRCETSIMTDSEGDDKMSVWFWTMIDNVFGIDMVNHNLDGDFYSICIDRLLNRDYEPNGSGGGLFVLSNKFAYMHKYDMRKADIWYQMSWYITDISTT